MSDPATPRAEFLAGDRPEDVLVYLEAGGVDDPDALDAVSERVDGGFVLVLPGEEGRGAFERATGLDPFDFAGTAMRTEGQVDRECTGGTCPNEDADGGDSGSDGERSEDPDGEHYVRFLFAFAEEHHPEMEDVHGEGDVIHAYAACDCGTAFSDRWVVGE